MPILPSKYSVPWYWRNGDLQTIWPALKRHVTGINYERERITTPDDDFLDLDWCRIGGGSEDLLLISHGLEGSSDTGYSLGMCQAANSQGWDVMVWNYRGCSGVLNKQSRYYHSGETGDLNTVVQHILHTTAYPRIHLIGFSVGGNITLKYLGEGVFPLDARIRSAVAFSAPCDLAASAKYLSQWNKSVYMDRFIKSLTQKIKDKAVKYPDLFDLFGIDKIRTFEEFDNLYTAPMFGYRNAEEYWAANSSKQFIRDIRVPTLLVSALNDPFFGDACYPKEEASGNPNFFLETPEHGGHCGFYTADGYWSEARAVEFIKQYRS